MSENDSDLSHWMHSIYSNMKFEIWSVWKWFVTLNKLNIFFHHCVSMWELKWTVWKSLVTFNALKRFLFSVCSHMGIEIRNVWKLFVIFDAHKRFVSSICFYIRLENMQKCKFLVQFRALKMFLSSMYSHMRIEIEAVWKKNCHTQCT